MNSPVFLKGEHIIDGLAGLPETDTKRILSLKGELFNADGTYKTPDACEDWMGKSFELATLLNKRNILWKAMLN
jgi:hypothetical protein